MERSPGTRSGVHAGSRRTRKTGLAYPMVAVVAALAGALLFLLVAGVVMYETLYAGRLLWGVSLMGVDLAGYRPEEARAELVYRFQVYARQPVVLRTSTQQWKATPEELGLRFNVDQSVDAAYRVGRVGGSLERLLTQWRAARGRLNAEELSLSVDDAALSAYLEKLEPGIDRAMRDAALVVQPDFQVRITPSSPGLKLEHKDTKAAIKAALLKFSTEPIELVVLEGSPAILEATLQETKARAERSIAAPLVLQSPDRAWTIDRQTLAAMLTFPKSSSGKAGLDARLDRGKLESMLAEVARQVDRPPVDARFHLTGNKVQVLRESRDGLHMDVAAAVEAIERQAASEDRLVALPLVLARPKVASADGHLFLPPQVIEEAKTDYRGGARERMDNIELAAKKLHGTVVPPGDVFSFNRELGATTLAAGFKWGWGITSSGDEFATVPSVAGGICQVSTTLFQAVFWAGYAIEERYPHVYWITRYGQLPKGLKGLDATMDQIFDSKGNLAYQVDVKFVNNGDSPVLIQAYADGQFLTFALFGKKPDWKVEISQPKIEDVVKADAEEVIEEDPNALEGKRIQIEVAQDGFKSTITRKVTSPGQEPRTLNLVSTYKPSRNMFLVGTKKSPTPMASPTPGPGTPVPATPTPSPGTPVPATPTPGPGLRTATPTPRPPVSTPQPKPGSPAPPTPSPKPGG